MKRMRPRRGRHITGRTIFIHYVFFTKKGLTGYGNNITYSAKNHSITMQDLRTIEKELAETLGYDTVVIMNYKIG